MMTQKKIKLIGLNYEKTTNLNPQITPIDPKVRE